ncbi:MAG TPA: nitrous oxide reductase accessory protein NosL, partial [Nitrobacter sp.]|nr:nitrous oxide reductase accessory protein NosL [Nitrobacter sp.]
MKRSIFAIVLLVPLALLGCDDKPAARLPSPHSLTAELIGHYCGMNVLEHPGPKGQI